jgi:enoyl-CoA hydratase
LKRVIYEKDPPLARIILNFPEKANVQDEPMVWDVESCLKEAEQDWDIKVLILKANGRGFCAGHPLGPTQPGKPPGYEISRDKPNPWQPIAELFLWPVLHLWEFQKPTIAQVHGYCLGGGTYYGLFTDLTIASEDAYFQMPLVQGLGLPGGSTMIEPWLFMNWKRAYKYLYTAQTLTAAEACQYGLVNDVVPREKLEETVEDMARVIAHAPLATLLATKQQIKRAFEIRGMRVAIQNSRDLFTQATSPETQQFREERPKRPRPFPRDFAAVRAAQATQQSG